MTAPGVRSPRPTFDVLRVLEAVALLRTLSSEERKQLAEHLEERVYQTGDQLMTEGEEGDAFFIVVSGNVDVSTASGGKIASLTSGDYAGEQALLKAGSMRNATLTASERVVTLVCSRDDFQRHIMAKGKVKFAKREAKRNAFMTPIDEDVKLDDKAPKTAEQMEWLMECVSVNLLFGALERAQTVKVLEQMELIDVGCDIELISQGDPHGSTFYVVEEGTFDVLVDGVKVIDYKRGGTFGELALLYDAPRAATVVATADSKVWEVDRKAFRYQVTVTARRRQHDLVEFLSKVELFMPLLKHEVEMIADALEPIRAKKRAIIFREGDIGDHFYIVASGEFMWKKSSTGEKGKIKPLGVFGERALHTKEKRAATIMCSEEGILLRLSSSDFNNLLGPVMEFVDDMVQGYKRTEAGEVVAAARASKKMTIAATRERVKALHLRQRAGVCALHELEYVGVLGKGGFGLVSLVIDPHSKKTYALKAIRKFQVLEFDLTKHIISEKRVMDVMDSPFLVNLHATYKDELRVYFLLDVCLGGELFTILRRRRYFDEPTGRFFAACVIEAFDYMHSLDIIYRDLKPENLVLDSRGYCKVADFGFAKVVTDKTFTLCGTPDYLCPEIVTSQGHGKGCDWWTLGVLIYEMLASFAPFAADDPIDTYRKIIRGKIAFPRFFAEESRSLIKGLLHTKPTRRLGVQRGGAENIRRCAWFSKAGFNWKALQAQTMVPPIIPKVKSTRDLSNFAEVDVGDDSAVPIRASQEFDHEF